jgi:hypothetical protein
MNARERQRGFVALIAVLIISAMLVGFMTSVGMASFYARFDTLGSENKREALALAGSCINAGLLALATSTDPALYDPAGQVITVGADARGDSMRCTIRDAIHEGATVTIRSYASVDDSFDTVSATVSLPPSPRILSWDESE